MSLATASREGSGPAADACGIGDFAFKFGGGELVEVDYLGGSGGHAAGGAAVGAEIVVGCALVPGGLHEGFDGRAACGAGKGNFVFVAYESVLTGVGNLAGVFADPVFKAGSHILGSEVATVGVSEYGSHCVIGSDEDETLVFFCEHIDCRKLVGLGRVGEDGLREPGSCKTSLRQRAAQSLFGAQNFSGCRCTSRSYHSCDKETLGNLFHKLYILSFSLLSYTKHCGQSGVMSRRCPPDALFVRDTRRKISIFV